MIYAKYYPETKKLETLEEHTSSLLSQLDRLKSLYKDTFEKLGFSDDFWKALEIASLFHDLGKVSSLFQRKIKKLIKEKEKVPYGLSKEIPHNFISPIFLYEPNVKKYIKKELFSNSDIDWFDYIFYTVAFHHERNFDIEEDYFERVISEDIAKRVSFVEWIKRYNIKIDEVPIQKSKLVFRKLSEYYYNKSKNVSDIKRNKIFILLKGILHRLDHSASAGVEVERERIKSPEKKLYNYLSKKEGFSGFREFQKSALSLQDKNIVLVASTGMGKTEFAINWMGDSKAFYTLPIRVSVNAMYDRFREIFEEDEDTENVIGLLHSDAIFYGLGGERRGSYFFDDGIEEHILRVRTARQLSMPITITTADQLFVSALKYPGFEKIYATLAYAKVVLDEPQSYSPDTLAIIIKGIGDIKKIGGKFCFMSATIPHFVLEEIERYADKTIYEFSSEKKHKIKIKDKMIDDLLDDIVKQYRKGKKVLVILNTVRKAQEIYSTLKEEFFADNSDNIKLLHSLFIQEDRAKREREIKEDFRREQPVIWIATQLVEASLDISYDVLFSEIASLDSLIQRMGRIYRLKGKTISDKDEANIYIAMHFPSDNGKVYDKDIVELTREAISLYDGKILLDEEKQSLMNRIFDKDRIKNTNFYKRFRDNIKLLDYGFQAEDKNEAQKIFREVLNVEAIPYNIYEKHQEEIDKTIETIMNKKLPYIDRVKSMIKLNSFMISIPFFRVKEQSLLEIGEAIRKILVVSLKYDSKLGLTFDNQELNNIL